MREISKALILFFMIVFSFVGCGKSTVSTSSVKENKKIVVTDGLGRKIELSKPAERVLTNYTVPVQMICTLGAQKTLVGADGNTLKNPIVTTLLPNSKELPDFKNKNTFNMEQGIALKPDLVLITAANKKLIDDIENRGLKVFAIKAESLDELKSTMTNLGMALGKEEAAAAFNDYYMQKIDFVKNKLKNVEQKDKQKVYIAGSDMYSTAGNDMFQNSLIDLCGGINVSSDLKGGWVKVSAEHLIQWNPDVIILTQYCGVKPADVLNNESFKTLNAVKNKKVYLIPSKISQWDMPCPQTVLGILWLSEKLNPKVFNDTDIIKEADSFYEKFYGTTFTKLSGKVD